jgi:hypothetical protein
MLRQCRLCSLSLRSLAAECFSLASNPYLTSSLVTLQSFASECFEREGQEGRRSA